MHDLIRGPINHILLYVCFTQKHRPKSIQSLEAINKKKTNKDVSISIGATTNNIDVTFPFAMNNDGVQEAAHQIRARIAARKQEHEERNISDYY
jgi:hypothetical protein